MKHMNKKKTYLSKTKYCSFWQCPKIAWLKKYKPEEFIEDDSALSRMEAGQEVGELAKGLFGTYVDVSAFKNDRPDIPVMILRTQEEMEKETPIICEASFDYNGAYCAVDLLKREADGWSIYERL